jgi:hypothetical protein
MDPLLAKIECWILDCVENEYSYLWEIRSVIEQRLVDVDKVKLDEYLFLGLSSVLTQGYVLAFAGIDFRGEEQLVPGFSVSTAFVEQHKKAWQAGVEVDQDVRFLISDTGFEHYRQGCPPEYFR